MNISMFDPLFSVKGHYTRFNNYLIDLFLKSEKVNKIIYYTGDKFSELITKSESVKHETLNHIEDFQDEYTHAKTITKKIKVNIRATITYVKILRKINRDENKYVFIASAGQEMFWILALIILRKPYACFVINTRHSELVGLLGNIRKWIFKRFIGRAKFIFVTEKYYIAKLSNYNKNIRSLNESILSNQINEIHNDVLRFNRIVLLGNLSELKIDVKLLINIINYIVSKTSFKIVIAGSVSSEVLIALEMQKWSENVVSIQNRYLSSDEYASYLSNTDCVLLPYNKSYAENATSGIMWDVFHYKKIFIAPDYEPLSYYANKYQVGLLLKPDGTNIEEVFRDMNTGKLKPLYKELYMEYSIENTVRKVQVSLDDFNGC